MSGTVESNSYKTLSTFVKIIFDFLVDFPDAVLYYYCDSAPIKIRNNRNHNFTPQQFRSELFMKLFLKINNPQFISRNFSVNDPEVGNHYITLITNEKQEVILNSIVIELKDLFEK